MKCKFKDFFSIIFLLFIFSMFFLILFYGLKKNTFKDFCDIEFESIVEMSIPDRVKELGLIPYQLLNSLLNKRIFSDNIYYIDDDGYSIKGSSSIMNVDFSVSKIVELYNYCLENNISFLYVIFPNKPFSDIDLMRNGVPCYRNATIDLFCSKLKENGVPYLDLRDYFFFSSNNPYEWFYKTDHHWKADAGFEASRKMILELNKLYNKNISISDLDYSLFDRKVYNDYWIGEIGRKTLSRFGEKDDFVTITPNYPTNLHFINQNRNINKKGDFSILLDKSLLKKNQSHIYYYYLYSNDPLIDIYNENKINNNIFYIKDSFSNVVIPFLSLEIEHLTVWDMRGDNHIYSYLEKNKYYDTIIVAYNVGMIPKYDMNNFQ